VANAPFRNQPLLTPEQLRSRLAEFYRSLEEFNDNYYFESHETLEDLWMVTPWPERELFQGIIQLAAAFVHYARREYPGILKLLDASAAKIEPFLPQTFGVDTDSLLRDVCAARDEFARLGEEHFLEFEEPAVPKIRFVPER
jgi:uncharacterized protein